MPPVDGVDVAGVDPGLWVRAAGPGWRGSARRLRLGARHRCQRGRSDLVVEHSLLRLIGVRACRSACRRAGAAGALVHVFCVRPRWRRHGSRARWRRQLADVPLRGLNVGWCRWRTGSLRRCRRVQVRRSRGRYWRRCCRRWRRLGRRGSVVGWRGVAYYHGRDLSIHYGDGCGGGHTGTGAAESVVWKRVVVPHHRDEGVSAPRSALSSHCLLPLCCAARNPRSTPHAALALLLLVPRTHRATKKTTHHARTTTHDDEKMLRARTGTKPKTTIDGARGNLVSLVSVRLLLGLVGYDGE